MVAMSSSGDDHPNLQTLKSFLATEILVQDRDLPGSRKELIAEMRTVRQQISKISAVISDISGKNRSTPLLNRRKKKAQALLSHRPSSAADGQQSYRMPPSVRDNLLRPQSVGPPSSRPAPVIQSTRSAGFSEVRSSARGQAAVAFGAFGAGGDQDRGVPDVKPVQSNIKTRRKTPPAAYLNPHERKELPQRNTDKPVFPMEDPKQISSDPKDYIYRGAGENGFLRPRGAKTMINFCPSGTLHSHRAGQAHRTFSRTSLALAPTEREMTRTFGANSRQIREFKQSNKKIRW